MPTFDDALDTLVAAAAGNDQAFASTLSDWEAWLAGQPLRRDGLVYWMTTYAKAGQALGASLAKLDSQIATMRLQTLADRPSPDARCLACWALAEVGRETPTLVDRLGRQLGADAQWPVREAIANAFDDVFGPAQPDYLYRLMAEWVLDANENIRRVPTNALMRYGRQYPARVIALMEQLRSDESGYVRDNVAFCLGVLGLARHPRLGHPNADNPKRLLTYLHGWATEPNPKTRLVVVDTLSRAWVKDVPQAAHDLLASLAADADKSVARKAKSVLKKLEEA